MANPVEIKNLRKYYRSGIRGVGVQALSGLNLTVKQGEVFGLLGPNGAGKSTAIKIVLGLLRQNSGECLVFGEKISKSAKRRIGYLPEAPNFYRFLTGRELVEFYGRLCGLRGAGLQKSVRESLELVGLSDAANRPLAGYSKGMLQRAGLAQAIVHNPDLVVLDEPSSGLDPVGMKAMADLVLRLKAMGKTVILCSHMMGEVETLCDSVAILYKGAAALSGNLDSVLGRENLKALVFENLSAEAEKKIAALAEENGARFAGEGRAGETLSNIFGKIVGERRGK
ncbi:MAG: ABC transporter ATP-binding protein [Opitutales bacterium]|nr:ABC transporter ATP-binding protein [Opitutales bacterium]